MFPVALALVSATAFYFYGVRSILSLQARDEYRRYGIPQLRVLNGTLQILGASGVLIGFAVPLVGAAAALGLSVMMLLGVSTRRRLGDSWQERGPASTLASGWPVRGPSCSGTCCQAMGSQRVPAPAGASPRP